MVDTGVITPRIYRQELCGRVTLHPGRLYSEIREPYFFGYVRDKLIEAYGAAQVRSGGLKVYTTIVPRYQRLAEKAISDTLNQPTDPAAALISISPKTGAIRAMAAVVPNRPKNEFNLLSQARRQPGSTFKTFVLTAAVEQGINPDTTYYVSAPFTYKAHPAGNCDDGTWWCVHTYANDYYGWSSIRSATLRSDNSVYAQLTLDVEPQKVADVARRMGVRSQLDVNGAYVPSIGLGSIAISPLDLATAYSTLANGGVHAEPMAIRKVVPRERPRRHPGGLGQAEAASRDLGGRRGDRDADPRGERPVGNRHRAPPWAGRRRARPGRTRSTRTRGSPGTRLSSRRRCGSGYTRGEIPMVNVHGIAVAGGTLPRRDLAALHGAGARRHRSGAVPGAVVWPTWKPFTRGEVRARVRPERDRRRTDTTDTTTETTTGEAATPRTAAPGVDAVTTADRRGGARADPVPRAAVSRLRRSGSLDANGRVVLRAPALRRRPSAVSELRDGRFRGSCGGHTGRASGFVSDRRRRRAARTAPAGCRRRASPPAQPSLTERTRSCPSSWSRIAETSVVVATAVEPGQHVRPRGGDVRAGATSSSTPACGSAPAHRRLAAAGVADVVCSVRPRVAVLATGSELRAPGEALAPGQIYESNRAMIAAALASSGRDGRSDARGRGRRRCAPRGARAGARGRRPRHLRRRLDGAARPRTPGRGGARSRGGVLGRRREARASRSRSGSGGHARLRPAWEPGLVPRRRARVRPPRAPREAGSCEPRARLPAGQARELRSAGTRNATSSFALGGWRRPTESCSRRSAARSRT